MYVVIELQKTSPTEIANLVTVHQTSEEAEHKYHTILAAAALSSLEFHAAVMLEEDGRPIKNEWYKHQLNDAD